MQRNRFLTRDFRFVLKSAFGRPYGLWHDDIQSNARRIGKQKVVGIMSEQRASGNVLAVGEFLELGFSEKVHLNCLNLAEVV